MRFVRLFLTPEGLQKDTLIFSPDNNLLAYIVLNGQKLQIGTFIGQKWLVSWRMAEQGRSMTRSIIGFQPR